MVQRAVRRRIFIGIGLIAFALTAAYIFLASIGLAPNTSSCVAISEQEVQSTSSLKFKIVRTDCDLIAKDSAVTISVSDRNNPREDVLLKYDPDERSREPTINVDAVGSINIDIDSVSSVYHREERWRNRDVVIKIGRIQYN